MAYVNMPNHLSILASGMPQDRQTRKTTYPWGETLSITRLGGSYTDLAAASTNFSWTLSDQDGDVIKTGKFTAIGGLSGSFESCYYPIVRSIESSLLKTIRLTYSRKAFSPTREVVMDAESTMILAVATGQYSSNFKWLDDPIPTPPTPDTNTYVSGCLQYMNVSESFFNRVLDSLVDVPVDLPV
jgi:hypothetical protein